MWGFSMYNKQNVQQIVATVWKVCLFLCNWLLFLFRLLPINQWKSEPARQSDVKSAKTGGVLVGRSEVQLKDVWLFLFWNPDKSDNVLTSVMLHLYHWMNETKRHTEQSLSLFQFSKRKIYQTVQSSQSSSHFYLNHCTGFGWKNCTSTIH